MLDATTILVFAQKELRDARRNRWFLLYSGAFAALALGLSWLGLLGLGRYGLAGFARTGASLTNLVTLIVPLMGLTLGALSLASERERGVLGYVLSQPITTLELLLGKFLGLSLGLLITLALGFGLSGLVIALRGGAAQAGSYIGLIGLAVLLAMLSLSVGLLISAAARKTSTAIGVALFAWLLLILLGDLGIMGTALVLQLDIGSLFTLALANPLQVFKMAALATVRGGSDTLEVLGPAGTYALRTYGTALTPVLLSILVLWITTPLILGYLTLQQKGAYE